MRIIPRVCFQAGHRYSSTSLGAAAKQGRLLKPCPCRSCLGERRYLDNSLLTSPVTFDVAGCLHSQRVKNSELLSSDEKKGTSMKARVFVLMLGVIAGGFAVSAQSAAASVAGTGSLEKQVGHELNMLRYVNVFDYMTFTVNENGVVTLNGEVTNPALKQDAGNAVKRVAGVERVDNQIAVLPTSFFDNGLRIRLFRTIYGEPALQKYGVGAEKSIRIIVDNGNVTLVGFVDNQADKAIAGIRAGSVPGIFSVDNQLQVVRS